MISIGTLKVGDRVQVDAVDFGFTSLVKAGDLAVVRGIDVSSYMLEFNHNIDGHDGYSGEVALGRRGHCWWVGKSVVSKLCTRVDIPERVAGRVDFIQAIYGA